MKKIILLASMLTATLCLSQKVGIATPSPTSTLSVKGSFSAAFAETSGNYTLTDTNHYLTFSGTLANQVITLPVVSGTAADAFTGRIYKIKNISTQSVILAAPGGASIRPNAVNVPTFNIPAGSYVEVVANTNLGASAVWDLSFVASASRTNVEIIGSQAKIPPHSFSGVPDFSTHQVSTYDTPEWQVFSKTSYNAAVNFNVASAGGINTVDLNVGNAKMVLVYEYTGAALDLNDVNTILTAGNSSNYLENYTANFLKLENTEGGSPRTRLTVLVSRSETVGSGSAWSGEFLLNILLTKKIKL